MTDINDLKFTIEPEETIEMEHFVNSDNKEKVPLVNFVPSYLLDENNMPVNVDVFYEFWSPQQRLDWDMKCIYVHVFNKSNLNKGSTNITWIDIIFFFY